MKKWISAGLVIGFSMLGSATHAANLTAAVKTDMKACDSGIPIIPQENLQMFSEDRIKSTLHGVWRGKVWGDYGKEFLDKDGFLNVDYYMIVDTERNEVLVLEQFTSDRSIPEPRDRKTAGWSYLMCGNENYKPAHPRQIHDFRKVSDNIFDAPSIVESSTGLKASAWANSKRSFALSEAWQKLVEGEYFDDLKFPAYAGGFFKQQVETLVNKAGQQVFSLHFETELRGGGGTAAEFERGKPIVGWEHAEFVGVSTPDGDFLVASAGNGQEAGKQSQELSGLIDVKFEHVVIGPLGR